MSTLCERVVEVTEEYLGPAADRFITRQISFHLNKKPAELDKADLPKLVEWVKVSLALLTNDRIMVNNCERQILTLADESYAATPAREELQPA